MHATSAPQVLASVTALLTIAFAKDFCNTATIGDFDKPETTTFTLRHDITPNQRVIQIENLTCPYSPNSPPVGMRVTACERDTWPQVHLRIMHGEVHRLGDLLGKATITIEMSCYPGLKSDEFEYV